MNLPDYIKQVGVPEFCKRFAVPERVAISYLYKARKPRPELAARIVATTPLKWEDIYGEAQAS